MSSARKLMKRRNFFLILFIWILFLGAFRFVFYQLKEVCGDGSILDLYFHYDADTVLALFSQYGIEGRKIYLWSLILDMIFPLLYGFLLWISITYLAERIHLKGVFIQILQAFPIVPVVLDYLENFFELRMVLEYPEAIRALAPISGWVTTFKWISVYFNLIVLILLLFIFVFGRNIRKEA